jgi:translation initiation factor 2B subunit (eIF-2B alpha/beta/delta family)
MKMNALLAAQDRVAKARWDYEKALAKGKQQIKEIGATAIGNAKVQATIDKASLARAALRKALADLRDIAQREYRNLGGR